MAQDDRFHIHVNRELKDRSGRPMKFYSEKDYTKELKTRGLERYKEGSQNTYKHKEYKGISTETRNMMAQVTYDKKTGKPNIGDRYIDKLKSMGVREVPKELRERQQGGWK